MAATRTLTRNGIKLRRTIGGWACRIEGETWVFRKNDDGTWRAVSWARKHGASPISSLCTLVHAVEWVCGHLSYCKDGCESGSGPFDSLTRTAESHRHSDDCHTYS